MVARRSSAESCARRPRSPKKQTTTELLTEETAAQTVVLPTPTTSNASTPFAVPRPTTSRVARGAGAPLPVLSVDGRLREQIAAADWAIMATHLVMAVCFVVVPLSCFHNLQLILPGSTTPAGSCSATSILHAEPWDNFFDL